MEAEQAPHFHPSSLPPSRQSPIVNRRLACCIHTQHPPSENEATGWEAVNQAPKHPYSKKEKRSPSPATLDSPTLDRKPDTRCDH
jgi:hypothetical protein